MKPGDEWTIPLCRGAHAYQHAIGERNFEMCYGINMRQIAMSLAAKSPALRRLRMKEEG